MTPAEFKSALAALGLSQMRAARILGIDGRSIRRYVSGERGISQSTTILLRLAVNGRITIEDIESQSTIT